MGWVVLPHFCSAKPPGPGIVLQVDCRDLRISVSLKNLDLYEDLAAASHNL